MRWLFAAYRKGALADMGEEFQSADLEPAEFNELFSMEVLKNYVAAWTLFADQKPIGLILGYYSHPNEKFVTHMIGAGMYWFPWASTRNKLEAAVKFFAKIRYEIPMMWQAEFGKSKRFFECICSHGVIRRVGTSHVILPDRSMTIFETRA